MTAYYVTHSKCNPNVDTHPKKTSSIMLEHKHRILKRETSAPTSDCARPRTDNIIARKSPFCSEGECVAFATMLTLGSNVMKLVTLNAESSFEALHKKFESLHISENVHKSQLFNRSCE